MPDCQPRRQEILVKEVAEAVAAFIEATKGVKHIDRTHFTTLC